MDVEAAFNTPHIVESLFKNLSALDLCRCACVSKLWNYFSTVELRKRKKTVYFYQGLKCSLHKRGHRTVKACSMRTSGKFEEELDRQIRNLEIKPAFCIAFANLSFMEKFESLFPTHPIPRSKSKKFKKEFDDTSREKYFESVITTALKKRLPHDCQVGLYVGEVIIDMNTNPEDILVTRGAVPAVSGYFFPELIQGIQFCKRKNHDRELFRALSTLFNVKSALALMEHKTVGFAALGLKDIRNKFNVFENGVVFPVQYGSGAVPLFYGRYVETACFEIPFSNDKDYKIAKKMEENGAVAFMFGRSNFFVTWKDFHDCFPRIPIAGIWGCISESFESTSESKYYSEFIKSHVDLNFNCKCVLISIKY